MIGWLSSLTLSLNTSRAKVDNARSGRYAILRELHSIKDQNVLCRAGQTR